MPTTSAEPASSHRAPYIRAGGGVDIRARRVAALAVLCGAVGLGVLAIVLAVGAVHRNAQLNSLQNHGVPVKATVTGCLGIGSGVGMGIQYWQCRGSYSLAGQTYNEVIGGSRNLLERGQTVDAVVAPAHPTVVVSGESLRRRGSSSASFIVSGALGAAAIALVFVWLMLSGRSRRAHAESTVPATGSA